MKKFSIKIPTPCHEDWNEMTPKDKGRFCDSCQKTVIDFSPMSDRQIADFFKRPAASICGRFHLDQLEREIHIPKKRIPWVKYFFQVSWPAFVLVLKSCGEKGSLQGELTVESFQNERTEIKYATLGIVLSEITPLDSVQPEKVIPGIPVKQEFISGEIAPVSCGMMGDTIAVPCPSPEEEVKEVLRPMDTVTVTGYPDDRMGGFIAGAISVVTHDTAVVEKIIEKETVTEDLQVSAFPNPVQAGAQLTIAFFSTTDAPKRLQLISSGGALIRSLSNNDVKGKNVTVSIPSGLAAGTYFIRMITENQQSKTIKIIVLN